MKTKTNVLLVHGAWADGSNWSKVIPILEKQGFNVTASQLPLPSLNDDIAVTRRLLTTQNDPTILLGHSYGGAVISCAANDAPQVTGLVYIAGWGLDEGESIEALAKQGPPPLGTDLSRCIRLPLDQTRRPCRSLRGGCRARAKQA